MVRGKEDTMCGRFLNVEGKEIFPSDIVELQTAQGTMDKAWGVVNAYMGKTIINARAETVHTLSMFKNMEPCIIPATGYFEWDKGKKKYLFTRKDQSIIHMAGVYKEDSFVIITSDAYEQFVPIHHRMPYIISYEDLNKWFQPNLLNKRQKEYIYTID